MSNANSEKLKISLTSLELIKKELNTIYVKKEYEKKYNEHIKINSDVHSHHFKQQHQQQHQKNPGASQSQQQQQKQHSCFYSSQHTSVPSTILITNNYSQNDTSIGLNNKENSITIVTRNSEADNTSNKMPTSSGGSTVVLDRINICINNHFNESRTNVQKSSLLPEASYKSEINIKEKDTSSTSLPIRTAVETSSIKSNTNANACSNTTSSLLTSSSSSLSSSSLSLPKSDATVSGFSNGQDVLVQKKDGRYYLGTIIAISRNQSLVRFDDNTECWSPFEELTKLGVNGQNDEPMCVVCKIINESDIVEVCERCGRGYHRKCTDGSFKRKGIWYCRRCTAPNGFKIKNIENNTNDCVGTSTKKFNKILHKSQLPYNLDSLSWDNHHRVNLEQIYCYCGKNGEWYNKMLQCCKCQQWFHEKCVNCLKYPVFAGDRFYIFACTMCNGGEEFLRRLELNWNDVVHLILFNITLYNRRKYYHANKLIVPFAIENWSKLQLQSSMKCLSTTVIRDNILKTLSMNSSRFKCGKEIKKKNSSWGLRSRIPPPAPKVVVPSGIKLNDQYFKDKKLNTIPVKSFEKDSAVCGAENSDNESSSVTSDEEFFDNKDTKDSIKKADSTTLKENGKIYCRRLSQLIDKKNNHVNDFDSNDLSEKSGDCADYDDIIKCNKIVGYDDNEGAVNYDDNEEERDDSNAKTFEVSVTAKSIKHRRKNSSPTTFDLSNIKKENTTTKTTNVLIKNSSDIIEISDSSDETSSRGTLDLIIPPPKNFQGRNNPFRLTTPKKCENDDKNKKTDNIYDITKTGLSCTDFSDVNIAAGQFRIVRTVKRRLSAKDITIGPNKEIKRRRLRRRSGNVEVISTATSLQLLPKSAVFLPIRTDSKNIQLSAIRSTLNLTNSSLSNTSQTTTTVGQVSNILNGRRLRQRQEKNYAENFKRNLCSSLSANNNTNSNSNNGNLNAATINNNNDNSQINISGSLNTINSNHSVVSLSELKTSVNMYFGGVNRILSGENFIVRAKRFTPDGKIQYLIEWEGLS